MRAANRRRLLDAVRDLGPLTQTEIVRATGLSAGTVSNLVHELTEAATLIAVGGAPRGRRGRLLSVTPPPGSRSAWTSGTATCGWCWPTGR